MKLSDRKTLLITRVKSRGSTTRPKEIAFLCMCKDKIPILKEKVKMFGESEL